MGVDYDYYMFVGVQVADENSFDDRDWFGEFEDEINGTPDAKLDCIYDGMSGKYVLLGKIIARGNQYNDQDAIQEVEFGSIQVKSEVCTLLDERLPEWREHGPIKIMFITHAH